MKKTSILIILGVLICAGLNATILIDKATPYYVGQRLGFTTSCIDPGWNNCTWYWGDGSTKTGVYNTNLVQYHTYKDPGTFQVHFHRAATFTPAMICTQIDEYLTINVLENRSIAVSPSPPIVNQTATFTATNFNTPTNIGWHFGDGTTVMGGSTISHTFKATGTYLVRALDWNGDTSTAITLMVTVTEPNRLIVFNPSSPFIDQQVLITAQNFLTTSINWSFGDGTQTTTGTSIIHKYNTAGTYTVTAREASMKDSPTITAYLTVRPENRSLTASTTQPYINQSIAFTAHNFNTPSDILWRFGDGASITTGSTVSHSYASPGTYQVQAVDWNGTSTVPLTITITVLPPPRQIQYSPSTIYVDLPVSFLAVNFVSPTLYWDFGDGTTVQFGTQPTHRYMQPGTYTVTARELSTTSAASASIILTILPENRTLNVSVAQPMIRQSITFTAGNFHGKQALWNFGDGTASILGPMTISYRYNEPGRYRVTARDDAGRSTVIFSVDIRVIGITDHVDLLVAELTLDNGKMYRVVPRNSKDLKGILRMKMRGTGIISGYWIVDDQPFEFFTRTTHQGEIETITTNSIPGLPAFQPGIHTVTVHLQRPNQAEVVFPVLKYFVEPFENVIQLNTPLDNFVAKETEIPEFTWERAKGASYYQIAFSSGLLSMVENNPPLVWIDAKDQSRLTPAAEKWNSLVRNRPIFWKVRAQDSLGNTLAESSIQEFKIIVPEATLTLLKVTDLDGKPLEMRDQIVTARQTPILIQGELQYGSDAEFLILRVFVNQVLSDQLLFRDLRKDEIRRFETSIEPGDFARQIDFQIVKSSSPAVIIGTSQLLIKPQD